MSNGQQTFNGSYTRQEILEAAPAEWAADFSHLLARIDLTRNQTAESSQAYSGSTWADLKAFIGPIEWAWPGWLPMGLLTMLASEAGLGKSALALRIGACFLCAKLWPDGKPFEGETGKILWAEAEAAQAINLQRAREWGLPLDKIQSPFDDPLLDFDLRDPAHREALELMGANPEVRLIVVDSLSGAANDDDKPETKVAVKWLAELAKQVNKPVLLVHHLRKRGLMDGDNIALDRVRGSSKIVQFARCIWALNQPDPLVEAKRLQVIKNNLGRFPEPVGMTIHGKGSDFGDAPEPPKQETLQDKAADLLLVVLAKGPKRVKALKEEFEGAGISWDAANRAKKKLGIVSIKQGQRGPWVWSLPAKTDT